MGPNNSKTLGFAGLAALAIAAVAAGCGGGGGRKLYAIGATEHCLFQQHTVLHYAEADADLVGLAAPGGGIGVTLAQNAATVGFERNNTDANDALRSAQLVGASTGPKLHADSNVYVSWDNTPTAAEKGAVENCLRSGSADRIKNKYPYAFVNAITTQCVATATSAGTVQSIARTYCGCVVNALQARWTSDRVVHEIRIAASEVHAITSRCQSGLSRPTGNAGTSTAANSGSDTPSLTTTFPIPTTESLEKIPVSVMSAEGRAIFAALQKSRDVGAQVRLLSVAVSMIDPLWASAEVDFGANTEGARAILHSVSGQWTVTIVGTYFGCSDAGMPPRAVSQALGVAC